MPLPEHLRYSMDRELPGHLREDEDSTQAKIVGDLSRSQFDTLVRMAKVAGAYLALEDGELYLKF